jgi:hypothetical protein
VIEDVTFVGDEDMAAAKSQRGLEHQGVETEIGTRLEKHGGKDVTRARSEEVFVGPLPRSLEARFLLRGTKDDLEFHCGSLARSSDRGEGAPASRI